MLPIVTVALALGVMAMGMPVSHTTAAANPPLFLHLAYGADAATTMTVSYYTTAEALDTSIKYGTQSGQYDHAAVGRQRTYNASTGFYHDIELSKLLPETKYYYIAGSALSNEWSREYQFTTGGGQSLEIVVYGDFGVKNSEHVLAQLKNIADAKTLNGFYYHVGDISYADDVPDADYESHWRAFFANIEPISANYPYMICPGNHESDGGYDTKRQQFLPYTQKFFMPNGNKTSNMWFSWNWEKLVHFVSMNTETDFAGAPEGEHLFGDQLTWLRQDLEEARVAGYKWIIVVGHRPIYSSADGYEKNGVPIDAPLALQTAVEDLFHTNQVDLFIVGHQHAYERSFPTYRNKVTQTHYNAPNATVHLVVGGAGCEEGIAANWQPIPSWIAHRFPEKASAAHPGWGYGRIEATADRLSFNYYEVSNAGVQSLEDSFVLTK